MLATASRMVRVMLIKREALPVPSEFRRLRVRSGRAWVTMDGEDVTLTRGQEIGLRTKGDQPVVSALGELPVVVELLADPPETPIGKSRPAGSRPG